ncbi:hypothetical protein GCM10009595_09530 [Falsarthrobacter nasiphocae]|uniref:Beta/Gamma crystallin n=1 Tax=Falsarthrobacter nasiphocae TaxID=189863 RepID=A0AAE4C588_9MICC|nr:hypothetical protein [Falsarthrobacter nasiphocae]
MKLTALRSATVLAVCLTGVVAGAAPAQAARFRAWDYQGTHGPLLIDSYTDRSTLDIVDDRAESVWNQTSCTMEGRNYAGLWGFTSHAGFFGSGILQSKIGYPNMIDYFDCRA